MFAYLSNPPIFGFSLDVHGVCGHFQDAKASLENVGQIEEKSYATSRLQIEK